MTPAARLERRGAIFWVSAAASPPAQLTRRQQDASLPRHAGGGRRRRGGLRGRRLRGPVPRARPPAARRERLRLSAARGPRARAPRGVAAAGGVRRARRLLRAPLRGARHAHRRRARIVAAVAAATATGTALSASARIADRRLALGARLLIVLARRRGRRWSRPGSLRGCSWPAHWGELRDGLTTGTRRSRQLPVALRRRGRLDPARRSCSRRRSPCPRRRRSASGRARRAAARRIGALGLLVALYGIGVTERGFGAWALRGAVLLALIAAWIWVPRIRAGDAPRAGLAIAAAGALALALATAVHGPALLDYRGWNPFGGSASGTEFEWDQTYGPITLAPQRLAAAPGTERPAALLEGRDARPLRRRALDARRLGGAGRLGKRRPSAPQPALVRDGLGQAFAACAPT